MVVGHESHQIREHETPKEAISITPSPPYCNIGLSQFLSQSTQQLKIWLFQAHANYFRLQKPFQDRYNPNHMHLDLLAPICILRLLLWKLGSQTHILLPIQRGVPASIEWTINNCFLCHLNYKVPQASEVNHVIHRRQTLRSFWFKTNWFAHCNRHCTKMRRWNLIAKSARHEKPDSTRKPKTLSMSRQDQRIFSRFRAQQGTWTHRFQALRREDA